MATSTRVYSRSARRSKASSSGKSEKQRVDAATNTMALLEGAYDQPTKSGGGVEYPPSRGAARAAREVPSMLALTPDEEVTSRSSSSSSSYSNKQSGSD